MTPKAWSRKGDDYSAKKARSASPPKIFLRKNLQTYTSDQYPFGTLRVMGVQVSVQVRQKGVGFAPIPIVFNISHVINTSATRSISPRRTSHEAPTNRLPDSKNALMCRKTYTKMACLHQNPHTCTAQRTNLLPYKSVGVQVFSRKNLCGVLSTQISTSQTYAFAR